mmetsp:Transcript_39094/g.61876  ORF Transcript_39094/g.61876 Transcript_39094/m.61876 type:complete len:97 (-) Transcript_39094:104-394(-)
MIRLNYLYRCMSPVLPRIVNLPTSRDEELNHKPLSITDTKPIEQPRKLDVKSQGVASRKRKMKKNTYDPEVENRRKAFWYGIDREAFSYKSKDKLN